jgi:hypothetical protein
MTNEFKLAGIKPDIIIVANNSVTDLKTFSPGSNIIFDSSNSFRYSSLMMKRANEARLNAHSVLEQGAFELTITDNS